MYAHKFFKSKQKKGRKVSRKKEYSKQLRVNSIRLKKNDVYIKTFTNFLFPKKKKITDIIPLNYIWGLSIVIVFVSLIYLQLFSSKTMLTEVTVNGGDTEVNQGIYDITSSYLSSKSLFVFAHSNKYIFSQNMLIQQINHAYPFHTVDISMDFPHITISLDNKPGVLHWNEGDRNFLIDEQGRVIRTLESYTPYIETVDQDNAEIYRISLMLDDRSVPLIYNKSQVLISEDNPHIPLELVRYITLLDDVIEKNTQTKVMYYTLESKASKMLIAHTIQNIQIYFLIDSSDSIYKQVARYKIFEQNNQILTNEEQIEYIDLRGGERIFYK